MNLQQVGVAPRVMEARPPYIRFEKRAVERRDTAGNVTWDNKDFILITPQGSKDTVDKLCDEYFPRIKDEMKKGQFPVSWYDAYVGSYEAWKRDEDPPVHGTAIVNWPAAGPAQIKILKNLGIIAVEDLASANEEMLQRIGMGARALKQMAQEWVTGKGDLAPLVQQLEALRQTNSRLEERIKEQDEELKILREVTRHRPEAPAPGFSAPLEDLDSRLSDARERVEASGPSDKALIDDAIEDALSEE